MDKLPLEVQTLYAELLERLAAYEAERAIGHAPGSFVTKVIKDHEYYYFQYSEPGGKKRQVYIGKRDDELDALVERHNCGRGEIGLEQASIDRLCALLRVGGIMTTDAASARVLRALGDAGIFRLGGVLVGTHAFVAIGNLLGVRWPGASLRTQDVDVAAMRSVGVALPGGSADIPDVLDGLEMGFLPVPGLDRANPTTSFKVRGQGLRLDLLTPASRAGRPAVKLSRFGAAAQPLKFLDFIMESTVRAAVVDGGATSIDVPDPARFALHKLIVAGERSATAHAKREKDLWQSSQLLEVLAEERPGDIGLAWEALVARGPGWERRVLSGLSAMASQSAEVVERVRKLTTG